MKNSFIADGKKFYRIADGLMSAEIEQQVKKFLEEGYDEIISRKEIEEYDAFRIETFALFGFIKGDGKNGDKEN